MESTDPNAPVVLDTATRLAIQRTRVAFERTIMAAVRTATSLITFGFSAYKFFSMDVLEGRTSLLGPKEFGLTLIALGLLSLFFAWLEYHRDIGALRKEYPMLPRSNIGITAALVAVVGSALFAIILFNI